MNKNNVLIPILYLSFFHILSTGLQAQVNNPHEVVAVSGNHVSVDEIEMSWTLGETIITTAANGNYILTQGFHQSEDVFLNLYESNQQQLVITPNEDGLNDAFILEDLLVYPDNEITIINRWGGTVFQARPYLNNWKGKTNAGKNLPEGTYYYIVKLKPNVAKDNILFGSVTIKK